MIVQQANNYFLEFRIAVWFDQRPTLPKMVPVSDNKMSEMLNLFVINATSNNIVPLWRMNILNLTLTKVPEELRHLDLLNWVDSSLNPITSIRYGDFNFTTMLRVLKLDSNDISFVENGAFQGIDLQLFTHGGINQSLNDECAYFIQGNYGAGTKIVLRNNKLKHFNASAFQNLLENIAETSGYPFAYIDITGSNNVQS